MGVLSHSTKSLRDIFLASQRVADFGHRWRLPIEGSVVLVEVILPRSIRGASDEHPEQQGQRDAIRYGLPHPLLPKVPSEAL